MVKFSDNAEQKKIIGIIFILVVLGLVLYFKTDFESSKSIFVAFGIGVLAAIIYSFRIMGSKVNIKKDGTVKIPGYIISRLKVNNYGLTGKYKAVTYKFSKTNIKKITLINSSEVDFILNKKKNRFITSNKWIKDLDYLQTAQAISRNIICIEFKEPLRYQSLGLIVIGTSDMPNLDKIYVSVKEPEKLLMELNQTSPLN